MAVDGGCLDIATALDHIQANNPNAPIVACAWSAGGRYGIRCASVRVGRWLGWWVGRADGWVGWAGAWGVLLRLPVVVVVSVVVVVVFRSCCTRRGLARAGMTAPIRHHHGQDDSSAIRVVVVVGGGPVAV